MAPLDETRPAKGPPGVALRGRKWYLFQKEAVGRTVMANEGDGVWVFLGERARFASGVFRSLEKAEACIAENRFSGLLTWYPLDEFSYDWATRNGAFTPKKDDHKTREFRQTFANGRDHYHYDVGKRTG